MDAAGDEEAAVERLDVAAACLADAMIPATAAISAATKTSNSDHDQTSSNSDHEQTSSNSTTPRHPFPI